MFAERSIEAALTERLPLAAVIFFRLALPVPPTVMLTALAELSVVVMLPFCVKFSLPAPSWLAWMLTELETLMSWTVTACWAEITSADGVPLLVMLEAFRPAVLPAL